MTPQERHDLFMGAAKEDLRIAERLAEAGDTQEAVIFIRSARKFKRLADEARAVVAA